MESKVNYALVGFCVILLSLALVATILWLSVGTEQKKYDTYQVYIQESVSGLNRKATVKYRGVNVGYVREIALVLERPNEVRLLLDIEQTVPLKQDTLVLLSTQGLTGLAYIELTGSSLNAAQPIHETGQLYPELQAKSSLLVRLDTAFSRFLENFNRIEPNKLLGKIENLYSALNVFLSKQNQSAVTNILQNIR
ncbi:MAG: MCE family protein [Thiotrichaceae bacterium]|nr:MCE family protein [Thiotrichaceae bacterium]